MKRQQLSNGIVLATAWLALAAASGLAFQEPATTTARATMPAIPTGSPVPRQESLHITPPGKASEAEKENSGGGWKRRRTAVA